jgi:hypothetical protein
MASDDPFPTFAKIQSSPSNLVDPTFGGGLLKHSEAPQWASGDQPRG